MTAKKRAILLPFREGYQISTKHPVVAITGSSGAGTTTVMRTFQQIFRREKMLAAIVEGDAFDRYDRAETIIKLQQAREQGE
jgi:phosphoribulokinase